MSAPETDRPVMPAQQVRRLSLRGVPGPVGRARDFTRQVLADGRWQADDASAGEAVEDRPPGGVRARRQRRRARWWGYRDRRRARRTPGDGVGRRRRAAAARAPSRRAVPSGWPRAARRRTPCPGLGRRARPPRKDGVGRLPPLRPHPGLYEAAAREAGGRGERLRSSEARRDCACASSLPRSAPGSRPGGSRTPLPPLGSRSPLERPPDPRGDPAPVEVTGLRPHGFPVDRAPVHPLRVEGNSAGQRPEVR